MCTRKFLVVTVVAVLFTACNKEKEPVQPVREVIQKSFVGDDIDGKEVFPAKGLYGENLLSEAVTVIKRGQDYSMCAILSDLDVADFNAICEATAVEIAIKVPRVEDFYFLYNKGENDVEWRMGRYIPLELWQRYGNYDLPHKFEVKVANGDYGYYPSFCARSPYSKYHDMLVQVLTDKDYITIEYFVSGLEPGKEIISTKVRTLKVVD